MKALSNEDLIELVRKIMNVEGSEEEIDSMIELLKRSVPHPESDLIFWNDNEQTVPRVSDGI